MPSNPPPTQKTQKPCATNSPRSRWHRLFCGIHECGRCIGLLAFLVLAPLFALWIVGLPAPIANRLLQALPSEPFRITANQLSFEPQHGFILHQLLVYPTNSFAEPIFRAGRIGIKPRILPLFRGRFEPRETQIENGAFYAPHWQSDQSNAPACPRVAPSNIYATLRFDDSAIAVETLTADLFFVRLEASGDIARHHTPGQRSGAAAFAESLEMFQHAPSTVLELFTLISEMGGNAHPTINAQLHIAATNSTAAVQISAKDLELRDEYLDELRASIEWSNNVVRISNARATTAGQTAALEGSLDLSTQTAQFQLESDLPPGPLSALLFQPMRHTLNTIGIEDGSGLHISLQAGPTQRTNLTATLRGTFAATQLVARGVVLSDIAGHLASAGDDIHFTDVQTAFGADGERGTGRGSFIWRRHQRAITGQVALHTDPNDFIPFLGSNTARLVQRFAFSQPLPHFIGHFEKHIAEDYLTIDGALAATNFSYRGVPLDRMTTALSYSNHFIALSNWLISQTNRETQGQLTIDLHTDLIHADLRSAMNPAAVAGLVSPKLYAMVSPNRFEGLVELHAKGVVDMLHNEERTDLILEAKGERLGRDHWFADNATFTVHALGGSYFITNLEGRAYGGDLRATIRVEPLAAGPDHRYISHIIVTNAELAQLAKDLAVQVDPPPAGRIALDIQITGLVSEAIGIATRGSGSLAVTDGALFRLPILGGLSDLLAKLVPGLGFAEQTDMTCSFTISNGAILSDDLILAGDVLSLKAYGDIELDGQLHLRAQVKLLRRGPIAGILRILTFPVTKLFEFQLTGTLKEPKWRPVNLPKELFLIFD